MQFPIVREVIDAMSEENKRNRFSLFLVAVAAVLIMAAGSYAGELVMTPHAGEPAPIVLAFYCPSEEIGYIGELLFPLAVLDNAKAKAELEVTDTQMAKLIEMDTAFSNGIKEVLNKNENKGVRMEDHIIAIGKLAEDARQRTNDILKPHQVIRLRELLLQQNGVLSIPKKDIRQMLRLEREQERKIDEIKAGVFRKIDETTKQAPDAGPAGRCRFAASTSQDVARALADGNAAIIKILTPEQKTLLDKMKGKPLAQ